MDEPVTGVFESSVTPENTALAMGSGSLPVLATPALVAMMEHAAVNALQGRLPEGIDSVGVAIRVEHLAASPVGMTIRAEAVLTASDGRSYDFAIEAYDAKGLVGRATHRRATVKVDKFLQRAQARLGD